MLNTNQSIGKSSITASIDNIQKSQVSSLVKPNLKFIQEE